MRRNRRRNRPLVIALYLNAALLTALLVAFLSRGNGSMALAARPNGLPQIAGSNGVSIMPAQFANSNWGCYLLDSEKETLCAYEYMQGSKELRLVAARYYHYDRDVKDFNTTPHPDDIKRINQVGDADVRGKQKPQPPQPQQGESPENRAIPRFSDDNPATRPSTSPAGPSTAPSDHVPSVQDIQGATPP
jgi:hypothetical protein